MPLCNLMPDTDLSWFKSRFRIPRGFQDNVTNRSDMEKSPLITITAGLPGTPSQSAPHDFPCLHGRRYDSLAYSCWDGSAFKKGTEAGACNQDRSDSIGTVTGTGLVMARTQRLVHVDPTGKGTTSTNSIVRAELVGVQAWLREIMKDPAAHIHISCSLTARSRLIPSRKPLASLLQPG